jgi:hypothetical protein
MPKTEWKLSIFRRPAMVQTKKNSEPIKTKTAPKTMTTTPTQQQQLPDLDNQSAIVSIRSFVSGDEDDSMMGFSLATEYEGDDEGRPRTDETPFSTPHRFKRMTKKELPESSPNLQNNPQLRWFVQASKKNTQESYFSSDSESNVTLEEVSNPLHNSITGVEVEDLFLDDDKEDDDDTEEDLYSSYKEDHSLKGGSVLSNVLLLIVATIPFFLVYQFYYSSLFSLSSRTTTQGKAMALMEAFSNDDTDIAIDATLPWNDHRKSRFRRMRKATSSASFSFYSCFVFSKRISCDVDAAFAIVFRIRRFVIAIYLLSSLTNFRSRRG